LPEVSNCANLSPEFNQTSSQSAKSTCFFTGGVGTFFIAQKTFLLFI